jgi:hypothetical protein
LSASAAESLQEVPNTLETVGDAGGIVLDLDGSFKLKRGSHKVVLPVDSEALRRRVRLLGVSYALAKIQNPTRAWLATASQDVWLDHLDYVLGPRVWGLKFSAAGMEFTLAWSIVLEYEWSLRREAIKSVVYDGANLKDAMIAARRCTELRETHFVTPALVGAVSAATSASYGSLSRRGGPSAGSHPYEPSNQGGEGKGKGRKNKGGKGGKGGKGKHTQDSSLARMTAEGKDICFAYNNPLERCADKKCRRAHVCRRCFGSHPMHQCQKDVVVAAPAPQ